MRRSMLLAVALLLGVAACSGGGGDGDRAIKAAETMGQGEGSLALVTWDGYGERGTNDPRVNWVEPFEKRTGCKVSVKTAATAQEMYELMANPGRRYDAVSAPPEIAGQLIADKQVAPVNPKLVDGYSDIDPELRSQLRAGGKPYGVPFTWGSNILMYDTKAVAPAPDSWAAIFDPDQVRKYSGKIVVRNSPLTIADAAIYLRSRQRSLKIKDPFALNRKQLDAAAKLVARRHSAVKTYWLHPSDAVAGFASGDAVLGQGWPYQVDVLSRSGRPVAGVTPREGVTGWMDAWMVGARGEHPNCTYQWFSWMNAPDVQRQVAEWDGVAPANAKACGPGMLRPEFCRAYHVGERGYIDQIAFARTPMPDCGKGKRGCTSYADWVRAWNEARR